MIIDSVITVAAIALFAIALQVWHSQQSRDGDWHSHGANKMRRWHRGKWEVRPMTPNEEDQDAADRWSI